MLEFFLFLSFRVLVLDFSFIYLVLLLMDFCDYILIMLFCFKKNNIVIKDRDSQ